MSSTAGRGSADQRESQLLNIKDIQSKKADSLKSLASLLEVSARSCFSLTNFPKSTFKICDSHPLNGTNTPQVKLLSCLL